MDDESRRLKGAWKYQQRETARAAFPLPNHDLAELFDSVEAGLEASGCNHSLRITREWLKEHGHDTDKVVAWLEESGGYCDCEVAANSRDHWEQNK